MRGLKLMDRKMEDEVTRVEIDIQENDGQNDKGGN